MAEFYREVMGRLRSLQLDTRIWTMPVEIPDPIPFENDHMHRAYDAKGAQRAMLKHPFYQAWTEGQLPIDTLRAYARQYFHNVEAFPRASIGVGTVAGAGLYAASHGSTLPLLGIQAAPWRLPRAAFAWDHAFALQQAARME